MPDVNTEGRGREISLETGRLIALSSISRDATFDEAYDHLNKVCGWLSDADIELVSTLHMSDLTVARWRDDKHGAKLAADHLRKEESMVEHYGNSRSHREVFHQQGLDLVARTASRRAEQSAQNFLDPLTCLICEAPAEICECYTDEKGWGYTS